MSGQIGKVNSELASLVDAYASGSLAAGEYRSQRRALICQVTGELEPQVEDAVSAEDTAPAMPAIEIPEGRPSGETDVVTGEQKSNALYWLVTAGALLIALAGISALFWYIFRK